MPDRALANAYNYRKTRCEHAERRQLPQLSHSIQKPFTYLRKHTGRRATRDRKLAPEHRHTRLRVPGKHPVELSLPTVPQRDVPQHHCMAGEV